MRQLFAALSLVLLTGLVHAEVVEVMMKTTKGDMTIALDAEKAPKTVENFLKYVDDGYYNGTIFHRVIKKFMIQGGGFTEDMRKKPTGPAINNEADNGLKNLRGTIAMARTNQPHSATSQFFINHKDNGFLDHTGKNPRGWGYAVFGKVTSGMDVLDAIAMVPTGFAEGMRDVPKEPVIIESVTRIPAE